MGKERKEGRKGEEERRKRKRKEGRGNEGWREGRKEEKMKKGKKEGRKEGGKEDRFSPKEARIVGQCMDYVLFNAVLCSGYILRLKILHLNCVHSPERAGEWKAWCVSQNLGLEGI
jgi:hypothetical protein